MIMKKILIYHLIFILLLIVYFFIYKIINIAFVCVFHEITGLYCPGCGLTRMIREIFNLNFYQAFRYNPLLFICSPFVLFLYFNYIYSVIVNRKSVYQKIPEKFWYGCLIVVLAYWVLRNIFVELSPVEL